MARKPRIDWELYKPQLLQLKQEGKSLTEINKTLFDRLGVCVTNARLSQVFSGWLRTKPIETTQSTDEVAI